MKLDFRQQRLVSYAAQYSRITLVHSKDYVELYRGPDLKNGAFEQLETGEEWATEARNLEDFGLLRKIRESSSEQRYELTEEGKKYV